MFVFSLSWFMRTLEYMFALVIFIMMCLLHVMGWRCG